MDLVTQQCGEGGGRGGGHQLQSGDLGHQQGAYIEKFKALFVRDEQATFTWQQEGQVGSITSGASMLTMEMKLMVVEITDEDSNNRMEIVEDLIRTESSEEEITVSYFKQWIMQLFPKLFFSRWKLTMFMRKLKTAMDRFSMMARQNVTLRTSLWSST